MNKTILALLVFSLLTGPSAFGSPSGMGHHHHEAVSPFDQITQGKSLHCLLNGHRVEFFCPHKEATSSDQSQDAIIANHCGGNRHSIPAAFNISQELSPAMPSIFQVYRFNESVRFNTIVPTIYKFHFLDVQYPPPRFI